MLNFILLDDDPFHNEILENSLKNACEAENIDGKVALKTTDPAEVAAFSAACAEGAVYFLDIVLTNERIPASGGEENINGLDVSRLVSENSDRPDYFVYISAYSEYGIAALHTHAFDFLTKPFHMDELRACLRAIIRDMDKRNLSKRRIEIGGDKLQAEQIRYISSSGNYSSVHTTGGIRKYRIRISELSERLLKEGFERIHRKYIVNRRFVTALYKKESLCILSDGTELPVSKKYMP